VKKFGQTDYKEFGSESAPKAFFLFCVRMFFGSRVTIFSWPRVLFQKLRLFVKLLEEKKILLIRSRNNFEKQKN